MNAVKKEKKCVNCGVEFNMTRKDGSLFGPIDLRVRIDPSGFFCNYRCAALYAVKTVRKQLGDF